MIEADLVIRLQVAKGERIRLVQKNYRKSVKNPAFKDRDLRILLKRWALMNDTDMVIRFQVAKSDRFRLVEESYRKNV